MTDCIHGDNPLNCVWCDLKEADKEIDNLKAQLVRNETSRLHWVKVRKELIKRLLAEKKVINSTAGFIKNTEQNIICTEVTFIEGAPITIKVDPNLCPKCGNLNYNHPRLGISHVCS